MSKVAFLGGGSFGTALSILLANKGIDANIYDINASVIEDINNNRRNDRYIKGLNIPERVTGYTDMDAALAGADVVVLAVPSHVIRSVCKSLKGKIDKEMVVVSIAKGMEEGTDLRLSEVISEELPNPVVVMSGPSHAEEVAIGIPTTIVVSSKDMSSAEKVQDLFMSERFRVYTNDDLIGVEIGGAVKNIIALAAGVCDGIGLGDNSKAALMTRGIVEISRIGEELGGKPETFFGLTGIGDLIVTCTSMHSRNRRAGILIGKGKTAEEAMKEVGMVVEGVSACRAFYELKEKLNVCMPITDMLYKVLYEGKNPVEGVAELMLREKKNELH